MPYVTLVEKQEKKQLAEQLPLSQIQTVVNGIVMCATLSISMTALGFVSAQTASYFGLLAVMPVETLAPLSTILIACFIAPIVYAGLQERLEQVMFASSLAFFVVGLLIYTYTQSY